MVPKFLSVKWCGEDFHRLGVQEVESLILVDVFLLLDQGRRREGKKKENEKNVTVGEEGFPGAGPALLAVQQVATVWCN
jgi:hypothetical protein